MKSIKIASFSASVAFILSGAILSTATLAEAGGSQFRPNETFYRQLKAYPGKCAESLGVLEESLSRMYGLEYVSGSAMMSAEPMAANASGQGPKVFAFTAVAKYQNPAITMPATTQIVVSGKYWTNAQNPSAGGVAVESVTLQDDGHPAGNPNMR